MNIIWLGHSGFRIEIENAVLLVDPWLTGNPMFPASQREAALKGATHILLTHGHGDHIGDAVAFTSSFPDDSFRVTLPASTSSTSCEPLLCSSSTEPFSSNRSFAPSLSTSAGRMS